MMAITVTMLVIWAFMSIAPQTRVGQMLRHALVVAPAARLSRIHRGHVVLTLIVAGAVAGLIWLIGHESVRLLSMGAPDIAVLLSTFEVTTYLDALAAIVIASSGARLSAVGTRLRALIGRPMRRAPRARRTRRAVRPKPANDDHAAPSRLAA